MVSYYTPRPPVFEVEEFPRFPTKASIAAFVEWSGFESAKKRYREKVWDLTSAGYNSDAVARPEDKFIRPFGDPDKWHPAQRLYPRDEENLQDMFYCGYNEYELKLREDY